jgi:ATP-binding cassette subfamily F protein 3
MFMTLLNVSGLTKYYGAERIFSDITLQIAHSDKIALVGVNGAGKSTLLKIIAGLEQNDGGDVHVARSTRIAYLAQEVRFQVDRTLWQEMEAAFDYLNELQAEISALEHRLADTDAPDWAATMERYGDLTARFEHGGGYQMEQRIKRTLQGLGFVEAQFHQRLAQFSGGQKTRAALAATLLSDPDLLLLDEPTNHLDMEALEWLEGFLKEWDGTLVVISHDRYFLDKVSTRTLELISGTLEDYPAAYNRYLELKAERLERRLKEYEAQQEFIAKTEEFIRRYKAGQRSKEAKGREKRLNRLKEQSLIARPTEAAKLKLFLDTQLRSGELVLSLDGLVVGFSGDKQPKASGQETPDSSAQPAMVTPSAPHVLLRADKREIHRGERVALLGPNGSGKTTLLRTLVGELKPLQGQPRRGHNVAIGYYAQGHDALDMNATVLEELFRVSPQMTETRARTLLGRFLFSGDDVFKRVGDLSGGERSRVALAQLTLLPGNLLVLDEPTNHLDIGARAALESILREYPGSILFVSHDRYFIDALADKLWIVQQGRISERLGNYSDYMAALSAEQESGRDDWSASSNQRPVTKHTESAAVLVRRSAETTEDKQRKRRLAALEAEVAMLEQELNQLKTELEAASAAQDVERVTTLGMQYAELEAMLNQRYDDWAQLAA